MSETIWTQLLADNRVQLGALQHSQGFRNFVERTVPEIVEHYGKQLMTFPLWIEIQYRIADALASISSGTQNQKIANTLSGYNNIDMFLDVRNTTHDGYALQMRGWLACEYDRMQQGAVTVAELFQSNPVAFLGPLLKANPRAIQ